MKTFTAVLIFAVILGCEIQVDAGSFNLSGSFNPGISFGRSRSHRQKYQARNSEDGNDDFVWPQPNHINNFKAPKSFNDPIPNEPGSNDKEHPQAHQHRFRHRARRQ